MPMKDYYQLTKPGIIGGNAITVVAGFLLASGGDVDCGLMIATLVGLSLVVASGCVMNNYIDRDIDGMMERTKNRALVIGTITPRNALIYGKVLAIFGLGVLAFYTNLLTTAMAVLGLFVYVVVYSLWLKRTSTHGTIVGSISGAMPPVVGYLAVSGSIDLGAVILFFILSLWQMPHSFTIAIYRLEDYIKAGIPVLPAKKGILVTKIQTLIYIALFVMATFALPVFGYTGYEYLLVMVILGLGWLGLSASGFYSTNNKLWARNMFVYSIAILVVFSIMIAIEGF
ncbi:MAG TPA: protoheme IX farnesyltransferase [Candidatus Yonathbacteria bacterium]|nr:protoheme IX farnesyltransferase [Candidatus Yonathbacteria bacterium]